MTGSRNDPSRKGNATGRSGDPADAFLSIDGPAAWDGEEERRTVTTGLDALLVARGASPESLAEIRGLLRTNGSGMVDLMIQKKVLPE